MDAKVRAMSARPMRWVVATVVLAAALLHGVQGRAADEPRPSSAAATSSPTLPLPSDRLRETDWSREKAQLEQAIPAGLSREGYRNALEKLGYSITAVNYDQPDYLEYEIVRNDSTFEVQIAFDGGSGKARAVDVGPNMWRTDTTERAMRSPGSKVVFPLRTTKDPARYSDRDRMSAWSGEKEAIEKLLGVDKPKGFYRQELEKAGYRVTAVNADRPDYLEYEVVKGDNSYEVQIGLDRRTQTARDLDVTTNLWQADTTDKALKGR